MAKKFMYVCLGILALAVAFHLGAQYGQAGYVDQVSAGVVAIDAGSNYVLLDNGEVWSPPFRPNEYPDWVHMSTYDLPVPASQVRFWCTAFFVDQSGDTWIPKDGWRNVGQPPAGVAAQSTTWSRIKAEFGE